MCLKPHIRASFLPVNQATLQIQLLLCNWSFSSWWLPAGICWCKLTKWHTWMQTYRPVFHNTVMDSQWNTAVIQNKMHIAVYYIYSTFYIFKVMQKNSMLLWCGLMRLLSGGLPAVCWWTPSRWRLLKTMWPAHVLLHLNQTVAEMLLISELD